MLHLQGKFKYYIIKAVDQLDHVMTIIAITLYKVIQELITRQDRWYKTDLLRSFFHACLISKIYFNYYFFNNLIYSNCWRHVVHLIHGLKVEVCLVNCKESGLLAQKLTRVKETENTLFFSILWVFAQAICLLHEVCLHL